MADRIQLSANFYLDEFLRSENAARRGYEMSVSQDDEVFINLRRLCNLILQPVRDALGSVHILSGYRDEMVNFWAGGSSNSQHGVGLAADFVVSGHSPHDVCFWISQHLVYDQLIYEFGQWTHASISQPKPSKYRLESFTAIKKQRQPLSKPKTIYVPGIMTIEQARKNAK